MRLIGNKIDNTMYHEINKEDNIWESSVDVGLVQRIWIDQVITSDYLIDILYDEINRE